MDQWATADGDTAVLIRIKAVPGASRDAIAGPMGDRLKVRVAAPPEGGRANEAICGLVASALRIRPAQVELVRGRTGPEKVLRVEGLTIGEVMSRLR